MLRERWPFEKNRRKVGREIYYKRLDVEDLLQIRPAVEIENQ
jgi:hypothetical protein